MRFFKTPRQIAESISESPRLRRSLEWVNLLCWVAVLALVAYDILLVIDSRIDGTWSVLMRKYGRSRLILPWLCGVLIGHLFHSQDDQRPWFNLSAAHAYNLIFTLSLLFWLESIVAAAMKWDFPDYVMTITAAAGVVAGCTLWPMRRKTENWSW